MVRQRVTVTGEPRLINLDGAGVRYHLFRVKYLRRMKMTVTQEKGLQVVAPHTLPVHDVENFLRSKASWVLRHLEKQSALRDELSEFQFREGGQVLFQGIMQPIRIRAVEGADMRISTAENEIIIEQPAFPGEEITEAQIKFAIGVLFARHARAAMEPIIHAQAAAMNLSYGVVSFKPHKSRWGSCSAKGNLNFNQFLLMAPENVMRYVVIHELAHLQELNHSPRFWALLEKYCADAEESKRWLRKHGHVLEYYYKHINVRMVRRRR